MPYEVINVRDYTRKHEPRAGDRNHSELHDYGIAFMHDCGVQLRNYVWIAIQTLAQYMR